MQQQVHTLVTESPASPRLIDWKALGDKLFMATFILVLGVITVAWVSLIGWAAGWLLGFW